MFQKFKTIFPKKQHSFNIIEFGCGQCCEYRDYGESWRWFGFVLNPPQESIGFSVHQCDYTKLATEQIKSLVYFLGSGFVSIFSTECCMNWPDKYAFYRRMFQELPIQAALVSGFYYEDKLLEEVVKETGGIKSYQSLEDQRNFICDEFTEWRTYHHVPSKMFGDRVVEVWKILTKND